MRKLLDKILMIAGVIACVIGLILMNQGVKLWLLLFVAGILLLLAGVLVLMKKSGLFRPNFFDSSPYSATDAAASQKIHMDDVAKQSEHGEEA